MLGALKGLNVGLRFVLELCMLAAFSTWGFHAHKSLVAQWLLGLGTPLLAAITWGIFLAPRSQHRLSSTVGPILVLILFGLATGALYKTGYVTLAIVFGVVVVVNAVLAVVWKQW